MGARLLAAVLVLAAALLDAAGVHGTASLLLVAAVPVAGVAALRALDEALQHGHAVGWLQVVLAVLLLALVLVAAAIRSPLAASEAVPAAAESALVASLAVLVLQALAAGLAAALRRPRRALVAQSH